MKHEARIWKTKDVFVAGHSPTITYNPRTEHHLEAEVRQYRDQVGKALSVSGPSKSGKTVLIERLFPKTSALWVQGSDLSSMDKFWHRLADALDAFDQITHREDQGKAHSKDAALELSVPEVIKVRGGIGGSRSFATAREAGRTRPLADLVRDYLTQSPWPIVVDDFHYVPTAVKRSVARAIKTLIPITQVVLIAVPHQAFEAVRAEPDMDGRVWQLQIDHWSLSELRFIARTGFGALQIHDDGEEVGSRLAQASYRGPFLMQQLCYDYALSLGVTETSAQAVEAVPPDWSPFFQQIANRSKPGVFDKLLRGPQVRGQARNPRTFKGVDINLDIYGAVLYGIAHTGAKSATPYQEIVRALEKSFVEPPRSNQVTNALRHMSEIAAKSRGSGDPALDYKDGEVHLLDPFLAFYVKYAAWITTTFASPPAR